MIFLTVACVILVVNFLFLVGSMIYTIVTKSKGDITPRVSLQQSELAYPLNGRVSLQPQVLIYHAVARASGTISPLDQQISDQALKEGSTKQDN